MRIKKTDNYSAKLEIWGRESSASKVYRLPRICGLPRFGSKKFNSYKEMNAWKKAFLDEIASAGGVSWKK